VSEPLLEVRDLRTWFDTPDGVARAVDGVDFRLQAGETLAIVGESGSGKSVTALSLLGLVPSPPARILEGSSVRYRGEELVGAPARRLRSVRGGEIAMVFQEPMTSLNPVLRIGEQVREAVREHRDLNRAAAREETVRLLERVGIPDPARRRRAYPSQLSGGQRQRVMIAMALAGRPSILVADEPTTALDVTVQARILDLLASIQEEFGMAVLLITHDLGVVAEVADRVVVLYGGRVVERAPVGRLFAAPAHPYTEGLLAAVPDLDRPDRPLRPIAGTVPRATDWPDGCRFRPRCPHAWDRCREEPPLLDAEAGRSGSGDGGTPEREARCWLVEESDRRSSPDEGERASDAGQVDR
jgi:oligopeptide/dipeptide ABC transporter ATP-binding protein